MSATSEELAAQSEQLQSSIAYFRVDANAAKTTPTPQRHAPSPKRAMSPAVTGKPGRSEASWLPRHTAVPPKRNGIALNLTGGGTDHRDTEFERM
jgi:methyl-accepting chemotaxis protein